MKCSKWIDKLSAPEKWKHIRAERVLFKKRKKKLGLSINMGGEIDEEGDEATKCKPKGSIDLLGPSLVKTFGL